MDFTEGQMFSSANLIRRFGNLTATSTSEVLVYARTYAEQASEAQRSVKSTSAQDDSGGSGAKKIRITYLNSSYVLKTEDVTLNGTAAVNTVANDIRFIENMEVIEGAAAAGAITLMTQTGGSGTEIAGIGVATTQAFFAHHYVPAGKRAWIVGWVATVDDEASLKLMFQDRQDGTNLTDKVADLQRLFNGNSTPPRDMTFERPLGAVLLEEKTYCRITVVPNQSTSTVIRAAIYLWEESL